MKIITAIMAAAILLAAPHAGSAQGAASSPPDRSAAAAKVSAILTAGDFRSKTSTEQTDILFDKVATLKKNLWSLWYPDGRKKPEQALSNHRKIVAILERHFRVGDPEEMPVAWLDLFSAVVDADDSTPVDKVILAHVRNVVADYERAQKNASKPVRR